MSVLRYRTGEARLTSSQEDYLKALYRLKEEGGWVQTADVAKRLGVAATSVSEMVVRLRGKRLVDYDRAHGQRLTPKGRALALEIVRHHRLIELFLVRLLGYTWDEVHDEAEQLEHVISERMEQRIFEILGRPELDPHGDPIPALDGSLPKRRPHSMLAEHAGSRVVISRVSDEDPAKLRTLTRMDLVPGRTLKIVATSEFEGPISVDVSGKRLAVPLGLARVIFVDEIARVRERDRLADRATAWSDSVSQEPASARGATSAPRSSARASLVKS